MRVPRVIGLAIALAAMACGGDEVAAPPGGFTSFRVEGRAVDAGGAPLIGGFAVARVWPNYKDEPAGPGARMRTGSDGAFALLFEDLGGAEIDSVSLWALGPGCSTASVATVIPRAELSDGPDGVLTVELPGPARQPVTTAVGTVCASADDASLPAPESFQAMKFAMRIDSVHGELVYGRWLVIYSASFGGWEGFFQGLQRAGYLWLVLTPEIVSPGGCTELRLAIPIGDDGVWGRAEVTKNDGCPSPREPLAFAPDGTQWHFP